MKLDIIILEPDVDITIQFPADSSTWNQTNGEFVAYGNANPAPDEMLAQVSFLAVGGKKVQIVRGLAIAPPSGANWAFSFELPARTKVSLVVTAALGGDVNSTPPRAAITA